MTDRGLLHSLQTWLQFILSIELLLEAYIYVALVF